MHNLHLIVTTAKTGGEACAKVGSFIGSWGTESNYCTICGAISEKNKRHIIEENWNIKTMTIDKINDMVEVYVSGKSPDEDRAIEVVRKIQAKERINTGEYWVFKQYAISQYERACTSLRQSGKKFDVLEDTFFVKTV